MIKTNKKTITEEVNICDSCEEELRINKAVGITLEDKYTFGKNELCIPCQKEILSKWKA